MNGSGGTARSTVSKTSSMGFMPIPVVDRTWDALLAAWQWLTKQSSEILTRGSARRLRVAETVSLGEKRFVSILHVDGEQFLLGGSSSNIVLLARLEVGAEGGSFRSVLAGTRCGDDGAGIVTSSNEVTR